MQPNPSDVIVVGGGPCGSFTALNLARLGCNVNVFEEHNEIGLPCHCAGHVSIIGLKRLGLHPLPSEVIENTFSGAIFHSPRGKKFRVHFSLPITCSINRVHFDKHLAKLAENAGANYFQNSRVESLVSEQGFVRGVVVKSGGDKERFAAKLVVDAEGVSSRILKQAKLYASSRHKFVRAVHTEVENVKDMETDTVEIFLSREYAPGFYAWLMPICDGKAKAGLATEKGNPKRLLRRFMLKHPTACKKLRGAKILRSSFHSIPLGGPIGKSFSNGFLAVGDVASQVKSTTGGGLILGMTGAKIAANVAYEALCEDEFSSEFLSKYQKRCDKEFGAEMRFMLKIRKMIDALPDDKLDDVIAFCARIGLDRTLRDLDDIDFQRRALFGTLWNPRMSLSLFLFLLLYLGAKR